MRKSELTQLKKQETDDVDTPTGLSQDAVVEKSGGLRQLLADAFVLTLKPKTSSTSKVFTRPDLMYGVTV